MALGEYNDPDLLESISSYVPACPTDIILDHIARASREACRRTSLYKVERSVSLSALERGPFTLWPDTLGNELLKVTEVFYDSRDTSEENELDTSLELTIMEYMLSAALRIDPQWRDPSMGTEPTHFLHDYTNNRFFLAPKPNPEAATTRISLTIRADVAPSINATSIPAILMTKLLQAIEHRTLQTLMIMPNTAWTDLDTGAYHARQFTYQIGEVRADSNYGVGGEPVVARGRLFAVGRRFLY